MVKKLLKGILVTGVMVMGLVDVLQMYKMIVNKKLYPFKKWINLLKVKREKRSLIR